MTQERGPLPRHRIGKLLPDSLLIPSHSPAWSPSNPQSREGQGLLPFSLWYPTYQSDRLALWRAGGPRPHTQAEPLRQQGSLDNHANNMKDTHVHMFTLGLALGRPLTALCALHSTGWPGGAGPSLKLHF